MTAADVIAYWDMAIGLGVVVCFGIGYLGGYAQ